MTGRRLVATLRTLRPLTPRARVALLILVPYIVLGSVLAVTAHNLAESTRSQIKQEQAVAIALERVQCKAQADQHALLRDVVEVLTDTRPVIPADLPPAVRAYLIDRTVAHAEARQLVDARLAIPPHCIELLNIATTSDGRPR